MNFPSMCICVSLLCPHIKTIFVYLSVPIIYLFANKKAGVSHEGGRVFPRGRGPFLICVIKIKNLK